MPLPPPAAPATQADPRIEEIEVLRACAILMVLAEHVPFNLIAWRSAWYDASLLWWRGLTGVDLFFAVSGFVIARSLLPQLAAARGQGRTGHLLAAFWLRRAFRLLPAAWAWIGFALAGSLWLNAAGGFGNLPANLHAAAYAAVNIANFYNGLVFGHGDLGITGPYWSLSLEEQFYLLLPLLALAAGRALPLILLAAIAYQAMLPACMLAQMLRPGALAAGVLVALLHASPSLAARLAPRALAGPAAAARAARAVLLPAGIFLCGFLLSTQVTQTPVIYHLSAPNGAAPWAWGALALLCGVLVHVAGYGRGYLMAPGPARRLLAWVGARSYALYLAHRSAYALAREIAAWGWGPGYGLQPWAWAALLGLAALLLLGMAQASYVLLEQPLRATGRRLAASLLPDPQRPAGRPA